jgi:hypothetical protein
LEPDTYSVLTGLSELRDPDGATRYVKGILSGLKRGSTMIGAGAVNYDDLSFFGRFAETSVDYIDMHFYNVDPTSIANAFEIARIAKNHGLPLVLTEAWLYKADAGDSASNVSLAGWEEGFRRDVFSFWQPLDIAFHDALVSFARSSDVIYISPDWSNYYFAYVDYGPSTAGLTYHDLVSVVAPASVAAAIVGDTFSETGERYGQLIATP